MATKLPRRPDGFLNGSQLPIDDQNETFWMPLGRHDNFGRHQIAKKSPQKKKEKKSFLLLDKLKLPFKKAIGPL